MIYPTRRAIFLMLLGAPMAVLLGLYRPDWWIAALLWGGAVLIFALVDAWCADPLAPLTARLSFPRQIGVGAPFALTISISGRQYGDSYTPERIELSLALDKRLAEAERYDTILPLRRIIAKPFVSALAVRGAVAGGEASTSETSSETSAVTLRKPDSEGMWQVAHRLSLTANQRGTAQFASLWLRWQGPLGLLWKQQHIRLDEKLLVTPNIAWVREEGVALFARDSQQGLRRKLLIGEGSEYKALTEFQSGMDRRTIDWNQSARHRKLLAKEYELERNNRLILAIDSGRTMSEPVADVPRIDRAISAALLLSYAGLRLNDQVSLFSFAAHPQLMTPAYRHSHDFTYLQRAAAGIAYSYEESNYTLALLTLAQTLKRRSLIVFFTEFSDPVSASLMIRSAAWLVKKHRLLFVLFTEAELERVESQRPRESSDVTRANVATALLNNRRVTISQLQRLGVDVLEADHNAIGGKAVAAYMTMKQRGIL